MHIINLPADGEPGGINGNHNKIHLLPQPQKSGSKKA